MDLPLLSAVVTLASLSLYVLLDGFDLGVGTLMLMAPTRALRDRLAESIEPTWDGNETWLIMAGVSLLAAFPAAYAILLPALYLPLVAMLIGLGFRAVAFDFRRQAGPMQPFWDRAFAVGSMVAVLSQGLSLGLLIQGGVAVEGGAFAGGSADLIRPLPWLAGLAVLCGYTVLGAAWATWRLPAGDRPFLVTRLHHVLVAAIALAAVLLAVAAGEQPALLARWTSLPAVNALVAAGLIATLAGVWRSTRRGSDIAPFLWAEGAATMALVGLVLALMPDVVPFRLDIWRASAPPSAQAFFLIGVGAVTPVVLVYTAFAYWTFRGKIAAPGG